MSFSSFYFLHPLFSIIITFSCTNISLHSRCFIVPSLDLTLVAFGCRNNIKPLGKQICLPIKKNEIWLKTIFFKVWHTAKYMKKIILKIGFVKEKFSLKSYDGKTLGKGRSALSPGQLGLISRFTPRVPAHPSVCVALCCWILSQSLTTFLLYW